MIPSRRVPLALGLLSVSLISLQLVLIHLLSISQWHHFAFLVVSVALLGFGASGTVIALFRERFLARIDGLLPVLTLACAALIAGQMPLVRFLGANFDSYLIFTSWVQLLRLPCFILLFTTPFFLGALTIGLVFVRGVEKIGFLYFANLIGSGLGAVAGLVMLAMVSPEHLPAAAAFPAFLAGLLLASRPTDRWALAGALMASVLIIWFLAAPPKILLSPYKDLARTLNLPGARVVASANDPLGQVAVVAAPALRYAPGVSLTFTGSIPGGAALFSNGNGFGFVPDDPQGTARVLDASLLGLPYAVSRPTSVLLLGSGTGTGAAHAMAHGPRKVALVEPHRAAVDLVRVTFPAWTPLSGKDPKVEISYLEPRTFLAGTGDKFDLIVLPTVGTFGGNAGLFSLREEYLLTGEALGEILDRLSDRGWFAVTAWLDYPPRAPLRLAAAIAEALEASGRTPERHMTAVRSWGEITFCVKKSLLNGSDISAVRAFALPLAFDPAILPGLADPERDRFNKMENRDFFRLLDRTLEHSRSELYDDYPFRLRPPDDDRPFFSQQLRLQSLPQLARLFGNRSVPFLELGYLMVLLTFVLVSLAGVILIGLPLLKAGWHGDGPLSVFAYFGGLGVGYMLFEMVLIHRLVLFLGHPVYSASAVISTILVFSGIGSLASGRFGDYAKSPRFAAGLAAGLITLYALCLPSLLENAIPFPLAAKAAITVALLALPGLAMGFPFPLGLERLGRVNKNAVPWAWGINGCLSVAGTSLATIIAVETGFTAVMLAAAAAYLTAALAGRLNE